MAIVSTTFTDISDITRLMKVLTDDNDTVDLLAWDQATGLVSSPSGFLSSSQLHEIQLRLTTILALNAIDSADNALVFYLLGMFLTISDITGVLSGICLLVAGVPTFRMLGFNPGQVTYAFVSVPHSISQYQTSVPM